MAYTATTVTDLNDLLDELYTFATGDGWTGEFNRLATSPDIRHIGIYKDNCYAAFGSLASELAVDEDGETDSTISFGLSTSLNSGAPVETNEVYWGHTGGLITTDSDPDRIKINDLGELSSSNVWFFSEDSGAPYIHVVVQSSAIRYTHFSIGIIDDLGMTVPNCAFAASAHYDWWADSTACNNIASGVHEISYLGLNQGNGHVRIPDLVVPSGFPGYGSDLVSLTDNTITQVMELGQDASDHWAFSDGNILDFYMAVDNQITTGGTSLFGIPWMFQEGSNPNYHVFLGMLPGIRIVDISSHTPADTLEYVDEDWMVFPWKAKGLRSQAEGGGDEIQISNTQKYGFAYKKNV